MTLPIPTFEDIRRALQFWIDQQDKWFYFETVTFPNRSTEDSEVPNPIQSRSPMTWARSDVTTYYLQTRIIGKIGDVINFPPSLMLHDSKVFTVEFYHSRLHSTTQVISEEDRSRYGLVFTQITYYEPIEDEEAFLDSDQRIQSTD